MDEHYDGDGCAVYEDNYRVLARGQGEVRVENLEPGDYYHDDAFEADGEWLPVEDVWLSDEGTVHVASSEILTEDDF